MHQGLARPAVEHFDVERNHLEDVGQLVPDLLPQGVIAIAYAEQAVIVKCPVAAHANGGGDVVSLELADQRVEHHAGERPVARQPLGARHERVLVGAVQRIAGLEGQRALPASLADQRAGHAR